MVTADFPEFLSGYYSIDAPLAAGSYLEFVVTVSQPDPAQARAVHFIIAATDPAPAATSADATVFLSRATPVAGGWHYFSYPLREAFNARAEGVPATWESIQVTLRFVAPPAGAGTSVIARFDDIYAGPQFANPNRDPDLSTH
jgi:hypothetical protein